MRTMTVSLVIEFDDALRRTGWTRSLLAEQMKVQKSAVSNWFTRGDIPVNQLQKIVRLLGDYEFAAAASEATFGVRIHSEAPVQDTPQARYFSQAKEENDRKKLDPEFQILLGKLKHDRTDNDRRRVLTYLKELDEEIEEKTNYKATIMTDWGLTVKEVQ